MSAYAAGWNTPGYLPDTEPATFDTAREAWQYLVAEVDRAWDEHPDDTNGACVTAHTHLHNLDQTEPGEFITDTPGYDGDHDQGTAWWVAAVHDQP